MVYISFYIYVGGLSRDKITSRPREISNTKTNTFKLQNKNVQNTTNRNVQHTQNNGRNTKTTFTIQQTNKTNARNTPQNVQNTKNKCSKYMFLYPVHFPLANKAFCVIL